MVFVLCLAGMCGNLEMVKDILTWRAERVEVRDKTDKRSAMYKQNQGRIQEFIKGAQPCNPPPFLCSSEWNTRGFFKEREE